VAVRFNAVGQHYSKASGVTDGCTLCMWIKMTNDRNAVSGILGLNGATTDFSVSTQADGTGIQYVWGGSSTSFGQNITPGTWYRLAMVHTVASTPVNYFAIGTGTLTSQTVTGAAWGAMTSMKLGCEAITTSRWFDGCIANFKAWDATLTLAELTAEFLTAEPQRYANLAHYHPFIGADVVDYSGQNRNLTGGAGAVSEAGPPIPRRLAPYQQDIPWDAASPIWYAVYIVSTGELFSLGQTYELQADQAYKIYVGAQPDLAAMEWDPVVLDFVPRAGSDRIDRVADLLADGTLTAAWASLTAPESSAMQARVGQMLGAYRYRDPADAVDL
jgi:hypothetical protein